MKKGFVKLYREYDERKWASDPVTLSTFIHCLWMARYDEGLYNGKVVPRGSFMISSSVKIGFIKAAFLFILKARRCDQ